MPKIKDARILIISANGVEQVELTTPRDELRKAGAKVEVATPDGNAVRGWKFKDWGDQIPADLKIADAKCENYDAIVIPGGQINPDLLRVNPDAVKLVKDFNQSGKIVAAVCHGPWLLVEAGIVRGKKMTSYKSIRTDVKNAGADVVDQEVVVDQGLITSRQPDDLPAFVAKIIEEVQEGRHGRRAA
jgi:protease I